MQTNDTTVDIRRTTMSLTEELKLTAVYKDGRLILVGRTPNGENISLPVYNGTDAYEAITSGLISPDTPLKIDHTLVTDGWFDGTIPIAELPEKWAEVSGGKYLAWNTLYSPSLCINGDKSDGRADDGTTEMVNRVTESILKNQKNMVCSFRDVDTYDSSIPVSVVNIKTKFDTSAMVFEAQKIHALEQVVGLSVNTAPKNPSPSDSFRVSTNYGDRLQTLLNIVKAFSSIFEERSSLMEAWCANSWKEVRDRGLVGYDEAEIGTDSYLYLVLDTDLIYESKSGPLNTCLNEGNQREDLKEITRHLNRLIRLGRALGIHLVFTDNDTSNRLSKQLWHTNQRISILKNSSKRSGRGTEGDHGVRYYMTSCTDSTPILKLEGEL